MRGIVLKTYDDKPKLELVEELEIPEPGEGEVLIRNHFGSINPSDLMFIRGLYGIKKKLPVVPGFEGSGVVEKLGKGVTALKVGDRVAAVSGQGHGTWGEYMVTGELNCIPLLDDVSSREGAALFVNPMTAWAMFQKAKKEGHKAIVQTAGASALGRMIIRLGIQENVPTISIVRREEQVRELHELGSEHVLNSSDPRFERQFLILAKKLSATICLDAVAGEVAGTILTLMPYGSTLLSYGALSEENIPVNAGVLIFQKKKIQGFWLTEWIQEIGISGFHTQAKKVQKQMKTIFRSNVSQSFPIESGLEALEFYQKNMSKGKVFLELHS